MKTCSICKAQKLFTEFYYDSNHKTYKSMCKKCSIQRAMKTITKQRKIRYSSTWLQDKHRKIRSRAVKKGLGYELNAGFIGELLVGASCLYCGDDNNLSIERMNNYIGYTKENCVAACLRCNMMRNNKFSFEEMKIMGSALETIRNMRNIA